MGKIKIQNVSASGCVNCIAAKRILDEKIKILSPDIEIEHIDMLSDKGQRLVQEHGIMASPGIIVNGQFFSAGNLNEERLIRKIKSCLR